MFRVLIVDDAPVVRQGMKHLIDWSNYGCQIAGTASDGLQALELQRKNQYDVIITDLKMPNMESS